MTGDPPSTGGLPVEPNSDLTTSAIDAIAAEDLEGCLLVGYYGGGNFGDELLLEVTLRALRRAGVQKATYIYLSPTRYRTHHHDFGYRMINAGRPFALLGALLRARSVIVGGGGLWSRDTTRSTLLLGAALLVARRLLGKNVYLLGVGYYRSSRALGHLSARLAGWASTLIVARDDETYQNFARITHRVRRGTDLANFLQDTDLIEYDAERATIDERLRIDGDGGARTIFIASRRFRDNLGGNFSTCVERLLAAYPDRRFILATLEPSDVNAADHDRAVELTRAHPNASVFGFDCNPLALYAWLRQHCENLVMIAPQYHALVCAHRNGIPLFPMAYDNKARELLRDYGCREIHSFYHVRFEDLCTFVDQTRAVVELDR